MKLTGRMEFTSDEIQTMMMVKSNYRYHGKSDVKCPRCGAKLIGTKDWNSNLYLVECKNKCGIKFSVKGFSDYEAKILNSATEHFKSKGSTYLRCPRCNGKLKWNREDALYPIKCENNCGIQEPERQMTRKEIDRLDIVDDQIVKYGEIIYVDCPRCGGKLIYIENGTSYSVECENQCGIKYTVRGI